MALKILSVLGTSDYIIGMHSLNGQNIIETEYIQNAVLKLYENQIENEDVSFYIFLTTSARQKHFGTLYNILRENYPKLNIVPIDIKDFKSKEEIWEIFQEFYQVMDENDEIVIDITHSFRHLPMQLLVVVNYAKVLKNVKVRGIYYGAFEAKYEKDEQNMIPIYDITEFDSLLEWSYGANTFINYGNVTPIQEAYKKLQSKMGSDWNKEHNEFSKFINALTDFSNCIYIPRGTPESQLTNPTGSQVNKAIKKSTQISLKYLNSTFDKIGDFNSIELNLIKPIINKVKSSIEMFDQDSTLAIGIQSIKWSMDKNLIPQAYTIFSETIKTYVCNLYNLDDGDYDNREEIVATVLSIKGKKILEKDWKIEQKYYDTVKNIISSIDNKIPELYDKVGVRRNDINHYGLTKNKVPYDSLIKDINELYEEFLNIINPPEELDESLSIN